MNIVNISGYKFIKLHDLDHLQADLLHVCTKQELKGTILLAEEGINILLAGVSSDVQAFLQFIRQDERFADIHIKESFSHKQAFQSLTVKIKPEIITFRQAQIKPEQKTVPHISPERFKAWLDAGREVTILDARNHFEVTYGTFENAVDLGIDNFSEFAEKAEQMNPALKDKPLVMFCTGGVRCEKAGPWLMEQGFTEVYQLAGGILHYFEKCGGEHYRGNCFVFDERVALNPHLEVVN